ncbi:MAG: tetratricopeptide repeat protein [Bacteriovoracaceae bacterium]
MNKILLLLFITSFFSCASKNKVDKFRVQEYLTVTKNDSYSMVSREQLNEILPVNPDPSIECELKLYEKANSDFKVLYIDFKKNAGLLTKMASCLYLQGKKYLALQFLERALPLSTPQDKMSVLINLGAYYHSEGSFKKALEYYSQAKKIEPDNSLLKLSMGRLMLMVGQIDRAYNNLKDVYLAAPYDPEVVHAMGTAFMLRKEYDSAIKTYAILRDEFLERRDIAINYALALHYDGKTQKALDVLESSDKTDIAQLEAKYQKAYSQFKSE